jgi:hypothetical protein
MSYSNIVVRNSISAMEPAALVFANGDNIEILDGLDGNALRGIARMLNRAAEHADEFADTANVNGGAGNFSLAFEIEWNGGVQAWPSDHFDRDGREIVSATVPKGRDLDAECKAFERMIGMQSEASQKYNKGKFLVIDEDPHNG